MSDHDTSRKHTFKENMKLPTFLQYREYHTVADGHGTQVLPNQYERKVALANSPNSFGRVL